MLPPTVIEVAQYALLISSLGLLGISLTKELRQRILRKSTRSASSSISLVFLFKAGVLIDTDHSAADFMGQSGLNDLSWTEVRRSLVSHLPSLPIALRQENEPFRVFPRDQRSLNTKAVFEHWGDFTRLTVLNWPDTSGTEEAISVEQDEFEVLSTVGREAPFPIWRMSKNGQLTWGNAEFFRLFSEHVGSKNVSASLGIPEGLRDGDRFNISATSRVPNETKHYEVTMMSKAKGRFFFATDANRARRIEDDSKQFIQMMAKTFAQLATGLAIFDRHRRLALYNPALMDQFDLSAEFLSSNPTFFDFCDTLRATRKIPEPRDYNTWREKLTRVVLDASGDRYREVWPLPSGETFRVTGRPHPDGSVAFLFEDISAELSLERRYRSQLELTRSVIDRLNQAIAVISAGGRFAMTNTAFQSYWDINPDSSLAEYTWRDFEQIWEIRVKERHIFEMISNFLSLIHHRNPWDREIALESGDTLIVTAEPIAGGYTMLTFTDKSRALDFPLQSVSNQ